MTKKTLLILILITLVGLFVYTLFSKDNEKEVSLVTKDSALPTTSVIIPSNTPMPTDSFDPTKIKTATLRTSLGDITITLNKITTPKTSANFAKLAHSGFYDGTKFHRIIKGFMNQGGDPLSKDDAMMARWGTGGPGYAFADEIGGDNRNDLGTISMANSGPNTNGSQFFLNAVNNNFLDDKHTVFGKVTKGLDILQKMNSVPTAVGDRPVTPIVIKSITLE